MKRANLLGKKAAAETPSQWRARLVDALRARDLPAALAVIDQPNGRTLFREGLEVNAVFQPFWIGCLTLGASEMLRGILAAAPQGITIEDACTIHHLPQGNRGVEFTSGTDAVQSALTHADSVALDVALTHIPSPAGITEPNPWWRGRTLHYHVLQMAVEAAKVKRGELEEAGKYARCCRVLLERDIPFIAGESVDIGYMFFQKPWHAQPDAAIDVVVQLMGDYVRAGALDINAPTKSWDRPLKLAAMTGNGHAAAAAIALGADPALAVQGSEFPDLFAVVQAQDHLSEEAKHECVTMIAEAVLRRGLAAAATAVVPAAPGARRSSI